MKNYKNLLNTIKVYASYTKNFRFYGYLSLFSQILGVVASSVLLPITLKDIIDSLSSNNIHNAWQSFYILVFLMIFYRLVFYVTERSVITFETDVQENIANRNFDNLLQRSEKFYADNFSGKLIDKFNRFINAFESLHDTITFNVVGSLTALIGVIAVLFLENIWLGFLFTGFILIYFFSSLVLNAKKVPLSEALAVAESETTGALSDYVTNSLTTIAFANQSEERSNFVSKITSLKNKKRIEWVYNTNMWTLLSITVSLLALASYSLLIYLFSKNLATVGTFILVSSYLGTIFDKTGTLSYSLGVATTNLSSAKEMSDLLNSEAEIIDVPNAVYLQVSAGSVKFYNVIFNYTGQGSDEIGNLNLEISPGESVGLVGHSGAGKSTIVKLLLRFVDVTGGSIKIDDQDIRDVTQESLRKSIAYVPQEPLLFHRTIRENIAYGKPEADLAEVIAAAKAANAHEFISDFPQGYETLVGERGVKLSGGQRQRVAIARAILKDAPILILDEATSSLDSQSEHAIQSAIVNLIKGKTVIAIAHRLSTIRHLDRIIVLENGKIIEDGSHQQLLEKGGQYADLWQHQSDGFIQ